MSQVNDIAYVLDFSKEHGCYIITNILGYRKVSTRLVPLMFTPEIKYRRKTICMEQLTA